MLGQYRRFAFEPPHVAVFRRYFATLAEHDGAVLIHCAAGKDRTGLLAALTLHLLDVEPDDIVTDYLATNIGADVEARLPPLAAHFEKLLGRTVPAESLRTMLTADPTWLAAAFAAITDRCGSVDAYLVDTLGVDAARRKAIRDRLIDPRE